MYNNVHSPISNESNESIIGYDIIYNMVNLLHIYIYIYIYIYTYMY